MVTSVGMVKETVETYVGVWPRLIHSALSNHARTAAMTSRAALFTPDGNIPSGNPLGDAALLLAAVVLHVEMFDILFHLISVAYLGKEGFLFFLPVTLIVLRYAKA